MTEKLNSSFRAFLGFSALIAGTECCLVARASARGVAAALPAVLEATLAGGLGFRTALADFLGEAGFFKKGLLTFGGDECEEKR